MMRNKQEPDIQFSSCFSNLLSLARAFREADTSPSVLPLFFGDLSVFYFLTKGPHLDSKFKKTNLIPII